MKLREMWNRLVATRYTSALEREVARLRGENRALLNSILGIAGVPPIVVAADNPAARATTGFQLETRTPDQSLASDAALGSEKVATAENASGLNVNQIGYRAAAAPGMKSAAAPTRRRSWHQIYRMLEINAARKKEPG
jgi:hypothetical protein